MYGLLGQWKGEQYLSIPIIGVSLVAALLILKMMIQKHGQNKTFYGATIFNIFAQLSGIAILIYRRYVPQDQLMIIPFVKLFQNILVYTNLFLSCLISLEVLRIFAPFTNDLFTPDKINYFKKFMTYYFIFTSLWSVAFNLLMAMIPYAPKVGNPLIYEALMKMSNTFLTIWFVFVLLYQFIQSGYISYLIYSKSPQNTNELKAQLQRTLKVILVLAILDVWFVILFTYEITLTLWSPMQFAVNSTLSAVVGLHMSLLTGSFKEMTKLTISGTHITPISNNTHKGSSSNTVKAS